MSKQAHVRLLEACDEIIELKHKLEAALKDNSELRKMYALKQNDVEDLIVERDAALVHRDAALDRIGKTPPHLEAAREEIETLHREIDRLHVLTWELEGVRGARDDAKTMELFWRRCAEQALRLWERAQSELDDIVGVE